MADISKDKSRALEQAIANLEKQFGKGTLMRLGDHKVAVYRDPAAHAVSTQ